MVEKMQKNWDVNSIVIVIKDSRLKDTMLTKLPVPYDNCAYYPISRPLNMGSVHIFNQEKALVGAFSVIVKLPIIFV